MIKRVAVTLSIIAAAAFADPMIDREGRYHDSAPDRVEWGGGVASGPTVEWLVESGWGRKATADEISAHEAEIAVANAEDARYIDPQPTVMVPRVDESLTNIVGESQLFIDADTGDVFGVAETGSPEHTLESKIAEHMAALSERAAWRSSNRELRASLTNNIADVEAIRAGLSSTSTAAQVRASLIASVVELRQLQSDVQALRRMLANHVKADE